MTKQLADDYGRFALVVLAMGVVYSAIQNYRASQYAEQTRQIVEEMQLRRDQLLTAD